MWIYFTIAIYFTITYNKISSAIPTFLSAREPN